MALCRLLLLLLLPLPLPGCCRLRLVPEPMGMRLWRVALPAGVVVLLRTGRSISSPMLMLPRLDQGTVPVVLLVLLVPLVPLVRLLVLLMGVLLV